MRQASWNEIFRPRVLPLGVPLEVPEEPQGWRRLLWWEDLLTFVLLGVIMLTVVASIDQARWVEMMPSLYPIAFFGLFLGAVLALLGKGWPEGFVHLLALPLGAAAALGQIMSVLPGPFPQGRYWELHDRMGDWFHAAFTGGISNDELPFVVLVVPMVWLAAYASSWAIFRWQNVWLTLIPGGATLLANSSFLPGQFSFTFVVFLMGGALLVTRLHLLERATAWRQERTPYPTLLSLSVLHASFWLGLALVGLAWLLPQAQEASAPESLWRRATAPVVERVEGLSRLFVAVDSKKAVRVHEFEDILPFLGSIDLPDTLILELRTEPLEEPVFLRAQAYDIYTPEGWTRAVQGSTRLNPNTATQADESLLRRLPLLISVVSRGRTGNSILTIGQPVRVSREAAVEWARRQSVVTRLLASDTLQEGDSYQAIGSVSVASVEELRAAGTSYPPLVKDLYLDLPDELPRRVRILARQITRAEPTSYDKAVAVESHLRRIRYDLDVPDTPRGRDTVDYFLFDLRRGYFDYHASAMVVMLRAIGVPSRLAVGYVLQESARDPMTGRYRVTEASAFAWPEVYFPGYGWVEFNPTPSLPTIRRAGGDAPAGPAMADTEIPELGIGLDGIPGLFPGEEERGTDGAGPGSSSDRAGWALIGLGAGLVVIVIGGAGGLGYAWVRGLSGLDTPARLWGQTVRLASWARLPPEPGQTPREYARTLRQRLPDLDGAEEFAESYVRYRYGRAHLDQAERARLEAAWRAVRGRLLRRLLRLR